MKVAIYCRLSEEDRDKKFETDRGGNSTMFTATMTTPVPTGAARNLTGC